MSPKTQLPVFALTCVLAMSGTVHAGFIDGHKLKELSDAHARIESGSERRSDAMEKAFYTGFVAGVQDSVEDILICSPKDVTTGQMTAIVRKYIQANPEKWSSTGATLVTEALSVAFPCKGK